MGNVDGYRLSTFMHKDRDSKGGKLNIGPIWDYNISSGNADYCTGHLSNKWFYQFNTVCSGDYWLVPFWWDKLLQDARFANDLKCRWKELRKNVLHKDTIFQWIDNQVVKLNETQQRNYVRWPILGKYVWPNKYLWPTYNEEVKYLKDWLQARLTWLDENMPGKCNGLISNNPENIIVYPNPTRQMVNLYFREFEDKIVTTQIFDLFGKKVTEIQQFYDGKPLSLDLNKVNCQNGMYFLQIFVDNQLISTQRILKE